MNLKLFVMATALALPAAGAQGATVVVTSGSGQRSLGIGANDPLGQIFTAVDTSLLSFGFQVQTLNGSQSNDPITLTLLSGGGFNGTTLATRTITAVGIPASTRTPTWLDFDLSGTSLEVGQTYTALLTGSNNRYGLVYGPNINLSTGAAVGPDAYAGGSIIANSGLTGICSGGGVCDANFRFSGTSVSAVPEPTTWAMMVVGFGMVGGALRRRRPQKAAFSHP
ncbi:PEPxxWA-CTERM sorting domain-containing protein [Sphingomonas sp. M1-B02]|uniref:PEPxxWA-CTERM sorting domain-containing protein n=1 Tax=Sphingomonas sp. M1-B02 TaxID=3114300 RepID=UPI00223F8D6F|nr:PEPxxWA-CTERM sorting domain-containing protein [Sphingomonas sp. S6-11]UZK67718.1 PEPxxWA-CTERM sorting domain-containing protein [Sphingomonas sp. S6-11]